jgi:DNA-binding GntR family transcriptional regulator
MEAIMQKVRRRADAAPRLYDRVYLQIREMIASGRLSAEEPVSEVQLSVALEVSRTPVREAVRRLVGENILQLTPKGLRVYVPSIDDLAEVYYTRSLLEGGAARLAALNADPAMLAELVRILRETKANLGAEDHEAFTRLNGEFHRAILRASGNHRIGEQLASLETIIVRYRRISLMFPDHVERSFQDHSRIVELFTSGTPETVETFVRAHVLRAGARVVRAMLRMEGGAPRPHSTAAALLALEQSGALEV